MGDSKPEVYLHFVWATKGRQPFLTDDIEQEAYRVMQAEVRRCGCQTVAIGGMPDHVHLLVRYGRKIALGRLMNQVKGVSSNFLNARLFPDAAPHEEQRFQWQPGYGVFSVGKNQVDAVTDYIENQKRRHGRNSVWADWEDVPESSEITPDE